MTMVRSLIISTLYAIGLCVTAFIIVLLPRAGWAFGKASGERLDPVRHEAVLAAVKTFDTAISEKHSRFWGLAEICRPETQVSSNAFPWMETAFLSAIAYERGHIVLRSATWSGQGAVHQSFDFWLPDVEVIAGDEELIVDARPDAVDVDRVVTRTKIDENGRRSIRHYFAEQPVRVPCADPEAALAELKLIEKTILSTQEGGAHGYYHANLRDPDIEFVPEICGDEGETSVYAVRRVRGEDGAFKSIEITTRRQISNGLQLTSVVHDLDSLEVTSGDGSVVVASSGTADKKVWYKSPGVNEAHIQEQTAENPRQNFTCRSPESAKSLIETAHTFPDGEMTKIPTEVRMGFDSSECRLSKTKAEDIVQATLLRRGLRPTWPTPQSGSTPVLEVNIHNGEVMPELELGCHFRPHISAPWLEEQEIFIPDFGTAHPGQTGAEAIVFGVDTVMIAGLDIDANPLPSNGVTQLSVYERERGKAE